ncbi:MAG: cytochrome c peroxidase [Planctomycetota bacterium]
MASRIAAPKEFSRTSRLSARSRAGWVAACGLVVLIGSSASVFTSLSVGDEGAEPDADALRAAYARPAAEWPAMIVDEGVEARELGLLPDVVFPDDNPYTKEKAELGKQLFYDPRLSASNQMACASCHDPDLGWADGRTVSFGTQRLELARNAPTILNSGHQEILFWDGRADSLEDLTLKVIENADEMHGVGEDVAAKINDVPEYRAAFKEVFGEDEVTIDALTKAVATFVRTVNGGRSAFDRFLKGNPDALSDSAVRGLHLFRTAAKCMNCHHGPTLSDHKLHNTGLSLHGRPDEDLGLYRITQNPEDVGKFKTPPLRHASRTGPYMHHGLFESLIVTVRAYNIGMPTPRRRANQQDDPLFPEKSPLLHRLDLDDQQLEDLVAFIESLEEPHRRIKPPELPPFAE